ncbi:hypothetical protein BJ742DRAFT_205893 [Cladochytrium replicatum]|nr:hypothetical protein BJ742DRAFT_205893 [Cladochytrium replicatum]
MHSTTWLASFALAALVADRANAAFFRAGCAKSSVLERVDPIVMTNGAIADHTHFVFGAGNFDSTANFQKLRASTCSTCQIRADLSAYWVPSLYYRTQDGMFLPVKGGGIATYYFFPDPPNMVAFPDGLRIIVGDFLRRSISNPPTIPEKAIEFTCLDYSGQLNKPATNNLPDYNCPSGLRMDIKFPGCWDGKNVDSADHKSHMAFTDGDGTNGKCPPTHPVRVPTIFLETIWDVNQFKDMRWIPQPFVLANGDPTGYSAHADFMDGWDKAELLRAIKNCDGFDLKACFPGDKLREDNELNSCNAKRSFPNDVVTGVLNKLPGCHPIVAGPAPALPSYPPEACTPTNNQQLAWVYQGCYADNVNGRALPNGANGKFVPGTCNSFCQDEGFLYSGTEYFGQCFCGTQLTTPLRPDSECNTPCDNDKTKMCGGPDRLSVFKLMPSGASNAAVNNTTTTSKTAATTTTTTAKATTTTTTTTKATTTTTTTTKATTTSTTTTKATTTTTTTTKVTTTTTKATTTTTKATTTTTTTTKATTTTTTTTKATTTTTSMTNSKTTTAATTTTTTKTTTSAITSPIPTLPAGVVHLGCYTDSTSGRALPDLRTTADVQSPAACYSLCASRGFNHSGVEYSYECFCSNGIKNNAVVATSGCTSPCQGNPTLICGGPDRINVYAKIGVKRRVRMG